MIWICPDLVRSITWMITWLHDITWPYKQICSSKSSCVNLNIKRSRLRSKIGIARISGEILQEKENANLKSIYHWSQNFKTPVYFRSRNLLKECSAKRWNWYAGAQSKWQKIAENSQSFGKQKKCRSNTKPVSLPSVTFALGLFSIRIVHDLGESYKYGYSRIKELIEYGYSKVEEPHEYEYFGTEEPHRYGYPIVKKLDGNIQNRHDFQILVIVDKQV